MRRRVTQEPPPRDRLGELLAPQTKARPKPKGFMAVVQRRSPSPGKMMRTNGTGVQRRAGAKKGEDGGEEDEEEEDEEEEDDDEDDGDEDE